MRKLRKLIEMSEEEIRAQWNVVEVTLPFGRRALVLGAPKKSEDRL